MQGGEEREVECDPLKRGPQADFERKHISNCFYPLKDGKITYCIGAYI